MGQIPIDMYRVSYVQLFNAAYYIYIYIDMSK